MDYIGRRWGAVWEEAMSDNRLYGADFVRAAACIMVVSHHVSQRVSENVLPGWGETTKFVTMMGSFGVGAFFVLSGYLLSRPFWLALDRGDDMPSLRTYAIRRAARILPGYWVALTVSFLLSFTLLGVPFDGTLLFRYISGFALVADFHWLTFFPVDFNGPLWSIGCEITSYVVMPLGMMLVFLLPKGMLRTWGGRLVWLAVIAAVVYAQTLAVKYLQPDSYQRDWRYGLVGGAKVWMPNYSPIAFFAIFAVGSLAAGVQVWVASRRSVVFDLLALAGAALAVWSMGQHYPITDGYGLANIPYGFPWFPLGVGLMLVSIPSSVLLKQVTEAAPIAFVARISFGFYVWHYMIMEMIRVLYQPLYVYAGMVNVAQWAWLSVGVIVVSVALATASYYWFEAPIIRWARGLERRPEAPSATLAPAAG